MELMKKMMVVLFALSLLGQGEAIATTYYVRADGGTNKQCTGTTDAAYLGSDSNQACAFNHPFWVLPVTGNPIFHGGDTLIIGPGEYKIGIGAPNTSDCSTDWAWDCVLAMIPPGPNVANPTRIYGKGWDTRTGRKPSLYGSQRVWQILELGGGNIELRWLDITDHSSCISDSPDLTKACNRDHYPFGDYADVGIRAVTGGDNVSIKDVDVHGLSYGGFHVGGVSNWILEDVTIRGNGFVGWDGDIGANSSNTGVMTFRRVDIQWNGCGETYPTLEIWGCWSQTQGGYGDGLGAATTGGDWIFDQVNISHNTSDGLDLLYHDGNGSVMVKRSRFEGNAGNQLKISAKSTVENSVIVGNCNYFVGKAVTETAGGAFDHCRAAGNSISVNFHPGVTFAMVNSTIYGEGDVLLLTGTRTTCNGTEKIISRNNIFYGDWDVTSGQTEKSAFYYASGANGNGDGLCGKIKADNKYSIVYNVKESACPNNDNVLCIDPLFKGPLSGYGYDLSLQSDSPAKSNSNLLVGQLIFGSFVVPSNDFLNQYRPFTSITWGAFELNPTMINAVEFYHARKDHYFNTANADDIAFLVANPQSGWRETGYNFKVYPLHSAPAETVAVARYYGALQQDNHTYKPDSHFYTGLANERNLLDNEYWKVCPHGQGTCAGEAWHYEKDEYRVYLPSGSSCPSGLRPVYRFYNNAYPTKDSNHRYVIDAGVAVDMRVKGWGDEGVKMCTSN